MDIGTALTQLNWLVTMIATIILSVVGNLMTPRATAALSAVSSYFARRRLRSLEDDLGVVNDCAASLPVLISRTMWFQSRVIVLGLCFLVVEVLWSMLATMFLPDGGGLLRVDTPTMWFFVGAYFAFSLLNFLTSFVWIGAVKDLRLLLRHVRAPEEYRAETEAEMAKLRARLGHLPPPVYD